MIPFYKHEARKAVEELLNMGVDSICVCLLCSYMNNSHELQVRMVAEQVMKERVTFDFPINIPVMPDIKAEYELLHKKVILPSDEELVNNNRAHSAKLRAIKKL